MKNSSDRESGGAEHPSQLSELAVHWMLFKQSFPLEEDCVEEVYKRLGVRCRNCGSDELVRSYGARISKCKACRRDVWMTSGTFFAGIRRVEPWLGAIWLLEHGVCFSASKYREYSKMAYSSVWDMLKKIAIVIQSEMDEEPIAIGVSSSLFAVAICKRSKKTPANEHPRTEQTEMERHEADGNEEPGPAAQNENGATPESWRPNHKHSFSQVEQLIFDNLSFKPKHIDEIYRQTGLEMNVLGAALLIMELDEVVQQNGGDTFSRTRQCGFSTPAQCTPTSLEVIEVCISFVRDNFHGIARKYLQWYLAVFWCCFDRRKWAPGTLLDRCARFRTIRRSEILAFFTPLLAKIVPV